ncbi:MAG: hypothetical protein KDA42_04085 [Planctomycetales bacterium]|nr:hypothetical protein [Planctomycetales bacterium]
MLLLGILVDFRSAEDLLRLRGAAISREDKTRDLMGFLSGVEITRRFGTMVATLDETPGPMLSDLQWTRRSGGTNKHMNCDTRIGTIRIADTGNQNNGIPRVFAGFSGSQFLDTDVRTTTMNSCGKVFLRENGSLFSRKLFAKSLPPLSVISRGDVSSCTMLDLALGAR